MQDTNGHFIVCVEVLRSLKKYNSAVQKNEQVHDHNTRKNMIYVSNFVIQISIKKCN